MRTLKEIQDAYPRLFRQADGETNQDGGSITSGLRNRYGWVTVIDAMADGDPTKWGYFEKMNVRQFLNMVQYYSDKQDEQAQQNKIRNAQRGR